MSLQRHDTTDQPNCEAQKFRNKIFRILRVRDAAGHDTGHEDQCSRGALILESRAREDCSQNKRHDHFKGNSQKKIPKRTK